MFRVLAFTFGPCDCAVARYRILQYCGPAQRDGIHIDHRALVGKAYYRWQIRRVNMPLRLLMYPCYFLLRFWQVLFLAAKYDAVWISREMAQLGPPIMERILFRRCKRVILDIDDAMHVWEKESGQRISKPLRDRGKFGRLASSYAAVVCGNQILGDYYKQHSANAHVIPTVVNADRYGRVKRTPSGAVRIGWIGTPFNRYNLETLRTALAQLARERHFELVFVGLNGPLDWDFAPARYISWKLEDELSYFSQFDIGIMPLLDSPFARGKCAFKLIQYMAAGIPVVASPVGANCDVVKSGEVGFLAATDEEWVSQLRRLIDDPELRRRLGENGRDVVRRSYSVKSAWPHYAELLTGVQSARTESVY